jgi:predicted KAP-like P-loop ATPase
MDGDRPIKRIEDDRLGFALIAKQLAQSILDQGTRDGLVFGVEGKWGSGKSTLINLTIASLQHAPHPPEVIEFSPWLVGSRDDLLQYLFDELAAAATRIDSNEVDTVDTTTRWQRLRAWVGRSGLDQLRRKQILKESVIAKKLRAFGRLSGGLSKMAKAAGAFGVPLADIVGTGIEKIGDVAADSFASTSLSKRKTELVEALKLLPRRIVVFVDDLDRLEPREASEVLRLVRAVADFPNVIYVMSYDVEVVAQTLQKAIQVEDGKAYLEKIVQVSFKVPRPEAFDLRRWFQDEVRALFGPEVFQSAQDQNTATSRLTRAIDTQGGRYLETPRDVIRALNALRLHAVPMRTLIDMPDMVWLQLVRIGNPDLYAWIEEYLTETSAVYGGAQITENAADRMGRRLNELLTAEGVDVKSTRFEMSFMLPGINRGFAANSANAGHVYQDLRRDAFAEFIVQRRLASPEHYRYYFAFALPAGSLRDDEVRAFVALAEHDVQGAVRRFSELATQPRPQGGVMAELLIDRLIAAHQQVPAAAVPGIFASLSATLDNVALSTRDGDFGQHRAWGAAERLVPKLLATIDPLLRADCLYQLFSTGAAIGWQTYLLRGEISAHGHYGDRSKPEDQRLLSPDEFEQVRPIMLARYAAMPPEQLGAAPNLISLLYGWEQAAHNDDAKNWAQANTQSEENLLAFLSRARGWSLSSDRGVQYPLKRQDVGHFLDYDATIQRVRAIAARPDGSTADRLLANDLLLAFEQGRSD